MNHHMSYHTIRGTIPALLIVSPCVGGSKKPHTIQKSKVLPSLVPRPPFNTARGKGYIIYYLHQTLLSSLEGQLGMRLDTALLVNSALNRCEKYSYVAQDKSSKSHTTIAAFALPIAIKIEALTTLVVIHSMWYHISWHLHVEISLAQTASMLEPHLNFQASHLCPHNHNY